MHATLLQAMVRHNQKSAHSHQLFTPGSPVLKRLWGRFLWAVAALCSTATIWTRTREIDHECDPPCAGDPGHRDLRRLCMAPLAALPGSAVILFPLPLRPKGALPCLSRGQVCAVRAARKFASCRWPPTTCFVASRNNVPRRGSAGSRPRMRGAASLGVSELAWRASLPAPPGERDAVYLARMLSVEPVRCGTRPGWRI